MLAYFAGLSALLGLDWDRHYLPTVVIGLLLSGLGAAAIVSLVKKVAQRRPGPAPAPAPDGSVVSGA